MHVNLWAWLYKVVIWCNKLSIEVMIEPMGWFNVLRGDFWDGGVKEGGQVV